jgi:hypothetical protein
MTQASPQFLSWRTVQSIFASACLSAPSTCSSTAPGGLFEASGMGRRGPGIDNPYFENEGDSCAPGAMIVALLRGLDVNRRRPDHESHWYFRPVTAPHNIIN